MGSSTPWDSSHIVATAMRRSVLMSRAVAGALNRGLAHTLERKKCSFEAIRKAERLRRHVRRTSENANCRQFTILHRICFLSHVRRVGRVLGSRSSVEESRERTAIGTFTTWICYRLQPGPHNLSPGRIFGVHADFGEFSAPARSRCSHTLRYCWLSLTRRAPLHKGMKSTGFSSRPYLS